MAEDSMKDVRRLLIAASKPIPAAPTITEESCESIAQIESIGVQLQDAFVSGNLADVLGALCLLQWQIKQFALVTGLDFDCAWLETVRAMHDLIGPDGKATISEHLESPPGWRPPNMLPLFSGWKPTAGSAG
jgi:hypothetical protein